MPPLGDASGRKAKKADRKLATSERALRDARASGCAGAVRCRIVRRVSSSSDESSSSATSSNTCGSIATLPTHTVSRTTATSRSSSRSPPDSGGMRDRASRAGRARPGDRFAAFMAELYRQGHARASVARKLSALRAFGRFLRREGWIEDDPAALAVSPRREQKIPAHLSRRRDVAAARDAGRVGAARPARSRDPRAVLRVRPAAERARGSRRRRRQSSADGWCG